MNADRNVTSTTLRINRRNSLGARWSDQCWMIPALRAWMSSVVTLAAAVLLAFVLLAGLAAPARAAGEGLLDFSQVDSDAAGTVTAAADAGRAGDSAASNVVTMAHTEVELVASRTAFRPGEAVTVGLRLKGEPHWHHYWKNPGDAGLATSIEWSLPAGFVAGPIDWPRPHYFETSGLASFGYEGHVVLPVVIQTPADFDGDAVTLKADVAWLACADVCIPGFADLTLTLPVADEGLAGTAATAVATDVATESHKTPARDVRWAALFDRAAADRPTPAPAGSVAAAANGSQLTLTVTGGPASIDHDAIYFFPNDSEVIEYGQAPAVTEADGRLTIVLQIAKLRTSPIESVAGVLVFGDDAAAWELTEVAVTSGGLGAAGGAQGAAAVESATWAALVVLTLLGFLGGVLLNIMPCVFPVLSIKVLGFVKQAGESRNKTRLHGLAYGVGVLASFWVLAAVLLLLRQGGAEVGWGFQLQQPAFVAVMAFLMFAIGLNLAGVFEVGMTAMSAAGAAQTKLGQPGYSGSFFTGVLATAVATPCAAPYMGVAIGPAVLLPAWQSAAVFTSLGVGMAAPYVLLAWSPALLRFLPRPGAWMETFKQVLAFPMFFAAIFLVGVYANQPAGGADSVEAGEEVTRNSVTWLLTGMVILAIGAWVYGRWSLRVKTTGGRWTTRVATAGLVAIGLATPFVGPGLVAERGQWEAFSPERVAELRAAGRPVFVDFTADWCITCKVNELGPLRSDAVADAFAAHDVALLKADWTTYDPVITQALEALGHNSVPVYAIYAGDLASDPIVLSSVLTPGEVVDALARQTGGATRTTAAPQSNVVTSATSRLAASAIARDE